MNQAFRYCPSRQSQQKHQTTARTPKHPQKTAELPQPSCQQVPAARAVSGRDGRRCDSPAIARAQKEPCDKAQTSLGQNSQFPSRTWQKHVSDASSLLDIKFLPNSQLDVLTGKHRARVPKVGTRRHEDPKRVSSPKPPVQGGEQHPRESRLSPACAASLGDHRHTCFTKTEETDSSSRANPENKKQCKHILNLTNM